MNCVYMPAFDFESKQPLTTGATKMKLYMTKKMTKTRNEYLYRIVICPSCYEKYKIGKRKCSRCKSPLIIVDEGIEDLLIHYWNYGIATLFSCVGEHLFKPSLPAPRPLGTEDSAPYLVFRVPQIAIGILKEIIEDDDGYYTSFFKKMKMEQDPANEFFRAMLYGYDAGDTVEINGKIAKFSTPNIQDFKAGCIDLLHDVISTLFMD